MRPGRVVFRWRVRLTDAGRNLLFNASYKAGFAALSQKNTVKISEVFLRFQVDDYWTRTKPQMKLLNWKETIFIVLGLFRDLLTQF